MSVFFYVWEKYQWSYYVVGIILMVGIMLCRFGSDEVKCDILSKIVVGEVICSFGYLELYLGLDVFVVKICVICDGDGW